VDRLLSPYCCVLIGAGFYAASFSVLGAFFLRLKWAQYEIGCLPQSRADVKNAENYTAMTPYIIVMARQG